MSNRGEYGKETSNTSKGTTALALGLVIVGVMVTPVIAIVGGTALASVLSGRGGKQ